MTIERMKRVWLLAESDRIGELLELVSRHELLHLVDLAESAGDDRSVPDTSTDVSHLEARIVKLQHTLDLLDSHVPPSRTFGENFVPLPLEASPDQAQRAISEFDSDRFAERVDELAEEHDRLTRRHDTVKAQLSDLEPFADLPLAAPPAFAACVGQLGLMSSAVFERLQADERVGELLSTVGFPVPGARQVLVQVIALNENADDVGEPLRRYGFRPVNLPDGVTLTEHVKNLRAEADKLEGELEDTRNQFRELAHDSRSDLVIQLGHFETTREVALAWQKTVASKHIAVAGGYVRRRQIPELEELLKNEMPSVGLVTQDPTGEEKVPVSLRSSRFFSPAQSLVEMFGVPDYFGFDPTPFVLFNFLVFFGCCFGDVIYGVVLIVAGLLIARRYRLYSGKRDFFRLMAYGGVASLIVGLLTGSWAADLWKPEYLGPDNPLMRIANTFAVTDPLNKPMVALAVALTIGVINQFYGIIMSIYRDLRKHNYAGAAFDGGFWLLFFPGLLLYAAGAAMALSALANLGLGMTAAGAIGLVLTQGRHEKGIIAKGAIGLISLYGIMGTYGTTGFVSDVLSYCRLLALGLTTMVVGLCFNIIASMLRGTPVAGLGLFVVCLLLGHTFNFLISILGAFVHSGRLIFVEFFGRFYDASGVRFRALGTSERVRVVDAE